MPPIKLEGQAVQFRGPGRECCAACVILAGMTIDLRLPGQCRFARRAKIARGLIDLREDPRFELAEALALGSALGLQSFPPLLQASRKG
ncbi:MAG TPA: hypothetical protein VHD36_20705 [Pirellulales bacterium]|nr:hypothetical protein [Pirellulales bacterium]